MGLLHRRKQCRVTTCHQTLKRFIALIRNKNLVPGRHYGVSKRRSTGKMSFLAPMPHSSITSSLLPPGDTPHTPHLLYLPETLFRLMSPRDTLGHHDTQSPDAVEAPEAPETAISIGDTGLTMHSTGQLSWQHLLEPLITDHSIMILIY